MTILYHKNAVNLTMFHFSKVTLNLRNDRGTFLSVSCFLPYCKQVGFLCRYDGCILRPCASFSFHRLKFFHCFYYNFTLTNLLVRQIKAGKICRIVPCFYNLKPLMSTVFARNYKKKLSLTENRISFFRQL